MTVARADSLTLSDYLRGLRRRWWLAVLVALVVPTAAYYFSSTQEQLYTASAKVLVPNRNPLPTSLGGGQGSNNAADAARNLETLAQVAELPTVASRTIQSLGVTRLTPVALLGETAVSADPNANILAFQVTNDDSALAMRLANEYANQFIRYSTSLQSAVIEKALASLSTRIKTLRQTLQRQSSKNQSPTARQQFGVLLSKQQDLQSALALPGGMVVQSATSAPQTQPKTRRNVALGLLLGLFFGAGWAFLCYALDSHARSAEEVASALDMVLLAQVPEPPGKLRRHHRLSMLTEEPGKAGEAYRKLCTNFDFANLTAAARTVMVTSAAEKEGKSTTVSNLAVAMARGGRRVVLVDLDLRRPFIDRFFGLEGRPGVTEAVLGREPLSQALVNVDLTGMSKHDQSSGNGNAGAAARGWLQVLPAGVVPPDPGQFMETRGLAEMLLQLRDLADVVLIDSPSLLTASDAMTLSSVVDGFVLIARSGAVHRGKLSEVQRLLSSIPAFKLGFILTDSQDDSKYGYGGYYDGNASTSPVPARDRTRESVS